MVWIQKNARNVPRHSKEPKEFNMEESQQNLFKRQEEVEKNFNIYLRAAIIKYGQNGKRKTAETKKNDHSKLVTF